VSDAREYVSASGALNRDQLILDHLPLLHHIVGRLCFDVPGRVERDDLYGWGMIGLIVAADSWDSTRGLKFSTYAFPKIRGAILDELRRLDFLPRGRREKLRDLERAVAELEQASGTPPSPEQIADRLGVGLEDIDEILHSARVAGCVSLEDGPTTSLGMMLSDPRSEDPVGSAEWEELRLLLIKAISRLPEQDKTVITMYYGEELLLKDIGEILGVTESRVSQIHSRALYRLNRELVAVGGKT
jgi:RNA polymerase sigma factor for flagellar operon FliA